MAYKNPADQKRYARWHYDKNRPAYLERAKAFNKKQRSAVQDLIRESKNRPCADCGVRYPYYVMHFDHLPEAGAKLFTISVKSRSWANLPAMRAEIAKCDVVCANCHAERTHRRGQHITAGAKKAPPRITAQTSFFGNADHQT